MLNLELFIIKEIKTKEFYLLVMSA